MPITQEYAEFIHRNSSRYEDWETFEFREKYIPTHLSYEEHHEPRALRYLMEQGYLQAPYFDWETRTVTQ